MPVRDEAFWEKLHRRAFRLDRSRTFMNAMLMASHPRPVREAIARHARRLDRDPDGYFDAFERRERNLDRAAMWAGRHLGLPNAAVEGPELVALTDSTTMGLGLVYGGLILEEDQEILVPESSPDFTVLAVAHRAARELRLRQTEPGQGLDALSWSRVRRFPMYRDLASATPEEIVRSVTSAIGPRTRVLALTWVSSATGLKLPLATICRAVAEVNEREGRSEERRVLVVADGVHGLGVEDDTFEELGCDFFIAGCHKWLFGPRGTGIVCGRRSSWEWVVPIVPRMRPGPGPGRRHSPGGIQSYEHRWALAEAFRWHLDVGRTLVRERTHHLAAELKSRLDALPGVRVVTPKDASLSAGIVCLEIDGVDPGAAKASLDDRYRIRAMVSLRDERASPPRHYLRLSPSLLNGVADVERTAAAVGRIAGSGT